MNKALIEKAFEKWAEKHKTGVESKRDEVTAKTAFIAGATWQAEVSATSLRELESKVKELEAEILNKEKSWYAEFPDEKSAQEVFNIIKELQAENKTIREQLIKELREWIESNKELRGYTGIPDDTLNIILAKLDELEGEK